MKNIFTGIAIIVSTTLFGQVTLLEENFDATSLPATWTIIDNDGNTVNNDVQEYSNAWIYKEDPINSGNGTASSTSYFSPVDRADRWLISPQITIGASGNFISWKGLSGDPSFPDSYKVMISKTGNTIADFKDTLLVVSNETPYWNEYTESLEEFSNEAIYIAFVNTTFDGFKLYLDSIYVREQDPLTLTKEEFNIGIYPNPIGNEIHISSENTVIENVTLYNSYGQQVLNRTTETQKNKLDIDVTGLSSGVYTVSIITAQGIVQRRVIKN